MMAVANDEWNGELTQFLDKLPARPCLVPPAPSFCSVCGSINNPVARVCRFYPLRHERERGQTFIELQPKRRADTFEIELDFEEEEEEELSGAPMFEFTRPAAAAAIKAKTKPAAAPAVKMPVAPPKPVEPEIYEAEVVEVIEEPPAAPAVKPPEADEIVSLAKAEEEARRLEAEFIEKQVRAEREHELAEQAELERKARAERERELAEQAELERKAFEERQRELEEKAELEMKALEEARAREKARPAPPAKVSEDQVLSKEEEARLEREIEEELAKAGLTSAEKAPGPAAPEKPQERLLPPDRVIAPIYSQPILKIIPPEGEAPKMQPLPPPPPGYGSSMAPPEKAEPLLPPPKEEPPAAPPAPEPQVKGPEPEKPAPSPAAPAPKAVPPAPGQRRTGGLYGIFRKAPKDQPKQDAAKNDVDDELAKRLKKEDK